MDVRSYIVSVVTILFIIVTNVNCVPGVKSVKQCYIYNNVPLSLRDLDSYETPTKQDIDRVINEEKNEEVSLYEVPFLELEEDKESFIVAVGGVNAMPREYPFMAALGYGNDTDREYQCGASLISEEFVLTAAHCIFSPQRGIVKYIRLGSINIANDTNATVYKMAEYFIHPQYTPLIKYHDIALIKLDSKVSFTKRIKPICLDHERKSLKHDVLFAAGWGLLGFGEPPSVILQKVKLRTYTPQSCIKTYSLDPQLTNGFIDEHQICAGTITNITDTCEGDSGGPLLYISNKNGPTLYYLTGITSFGVPCGIDQLPAVYTRVSHYIDWIEKIVWPKA